ncbi:pyridoxal phosphate-dependent transferase [Mariannaea sp. PMI_226]|nr:pyridoxal phosphate-dependent transferase [Mariannaea sp. PMI_226]
MPSTVTIHQVRAQFHGLDQDQIFLENAAGSQVVASCIESMSYFMADKNVQLGFDYPLSQEATSCSHTHESHLPPWVQVAQWKDLKVKWWLPLRDTTTNPKVEADDLKAQRLINNRTKIVCFTYTSNVLGSVTDVAAVTRSIKSINPNTLVSVDGVAYTPHAAIDVQAFRVDFYYFSWYKVYGPHIATRFVDALAFKNLEPLGHFFLPKTSAQYILGLTRGSYEAMQSVSSVVEYIHSVN